LPAQLRLSTDLHLLSALAFNVEGTHSISHYYKTPQPRTLIFGPPVSLPTFSLVATSPYGRPRAEIASQTEYPTAMLVEFTETVSATATRLVSVFTTAAFLGDTPAKWDITVPALTTAGYNTAAGLTSTSFLWSITAHSGDVASRLGGPGFDGATVMTASRSGQVEAAGGMAKANRPE